jgi:beta-lactamase regulating signal transducer with metallopeptidase domain
VADLFWAYWDASIRFALLALLLLLITPLLKRIISPRLLCWAWAILLLRLELPFSLPFSGSIFNAHENLQPSTWTETIRRGVVNAGLGETILPVRRDEDGAFVEERSAVEVFLRWSGSA